jgi:hypothetical protein
LILLVAVIFRMAGHEATKRFTLLVNPPLFAVLNRLEAPLSGASATPSNWRGWWI